MVLGAFAAIGQHNIKRLMAYSSIGHMGFALVGLAAGTQAGVRRRRDLYAIIWS
jgi:NADH-quinone oxidoreductase subunit N